MVYLPPAKVLRIRNEINSFFQRDDETFYECWERLKDLQKHCPPQLIPSWDLVQSFYKGVIQAVRVNIDAAAGGTIERNQAMQHIKAEGCAKKGEI